MVIFVLFFFSNLFIDDIEGIFTVVNICGRILNTSLVVAAFLLCSIFLNLFLVRVYFDGFLEFSLIDYVFLCLLWRSSLSSVLRCLLIFMQTFNWPLNCCRLLLKFISLAHFNSRISRWGLPRDRLQRHSCSFLCLIISDLLFLSS